MPRVALEGTDPEVRAAIQAALDRVRRKPGSGEAWGNLGQILLAHSYNAEAETAFREAARLDPEEPRWPYLLGLRELKRDPEAAVPLLERAVDLVDRREIDNPVPLIRLAETMLELGRYEAAETYFQRVVAWEQDNPQAHYGLGLLALQRNDTDTALRELKRAAASPVLRRKAFTQLATAYLQAGNRELSEEFTRLAERAPPDESAHDPFLSECLATQTGRKKEVERAGELHRAGKSKEALAMLQKMAGEKPDESSYLAFGATLAEVGELERAEEALLRAVEQAPESVRAHLFLAMVRFARGDGIWGDLLKREQAREFFRGAADSAGKAVELMPSHAPAMLVRGQALVRLGRDEEALDSYRAAVRARPELPEPHLRLGQLLVEKQRIDEGLKELQLAVELSPPGDSEASKALEKARLATPRQ